MIKKTASPKSPGAKVSKTRGDSSTARFLAAAERLKVANTASPEIARAKLKEMGILDENGKLSENYK